MRPREKVLNLGTESLTDVELLMLLIGSGTKKASVKYIASTLLSEFGSLPKIFQASPTKLMEISGVGVAIATKLLAIGEIIRRISVLNLPEREYLLFVCGDGSRAYIWSGKHDQVEVDLDLSFLDCKDVKIYHYHRKNKLPSISDEWLLFKLRDRNIDVEDYKIITSHLNIFDVISKVDYIKGE